MRAALPQAFGEVCGIKECPVPRLFRLSGVSRMKRIWPFRMPRRGLIEECIIVIYVRL